jgi:hypothetical protein
MVVGQKMILQRSMVSYLLITNGSGFAFEGLKDLIQVPEGHGILHTDQLNKHLEHFCFQSTHRMAWLIGRRR